MAQPYPISRETREEAIFFGDGGAVYGPFALKIFDVDDVEVWTKATDGTWTIATPTVAKVDPALAFDEFTITFAVNIPLTTKIKVLSARTHERSAGVTSGTKLSADALERELTKHGTILQELRRDVDRSVTLEFEASPLAIAAAIGDGHSLMLQDNMLVEGPSAAEIEAAQAQAVAAAASASAAALARDAAILAAASVDLKRVANIADLKAVDPTTTKVVFMMEAGKEGIFHWRDGAYSTKITADPSSGVVVKSNTVAPTAGAWVRVVGTAYLATWFGLVQGESAVNHTAIKNAIVAAAGVFPVVIPPGDYTLTGGITNNQPNVHIIAHGATVRANFANILFRSLYPYHRVKIEGGVWDGLNVATRGFWIASNHPRVSGCEVKGFNDVGILFGGVASDYVQNPIAHGNYVHNNAGIGIGFSRATRAVASSNVIRDSGLHAMTMDNIGGAYNIAIGNIMDGACTVAGSAVFATDLSQHLIVANNHIANGTTWGITTPNNEGHTDGMIIVGNALVNNQSGGIKLLRNNAPAGAGAPGPVLCSNCLIDLNTFVNNGPLKISIVIDDMGSTLGPNKIGANNLYRDSALPSYPSRTLGTPVTFFATYSADQADVTGDGTDFTMVPNTATLNEGAGYNNATGVFTAPRNGLYEFTAGAALAGLNSAVHTHIIMSILTSADGNWRSTSAVSAASSIDGGQVKSPPLRLNGGDTVEARVRVVGSSKVVDLSFTGGYTFFSGRLVHEW